ncbi:neuromedin-U receptor 1-like [Lytechinus variegatus]|uniref:neuromedin-U receptor 1-like n=1 Tax=Lytechinus variegatus TaxID=7654 RepID=UPI001BB12602|nr:neuromedin-U receptor 1-like [Lytechinus variegatus]
MSEVLDPAFFVNHQFAGKILMACISPLFPIIIVSNALLILIVYRNHRLRTPTNAIVASLAFSNLVDALIGLPLYTYGVVFKIEEACTADGDTLYHLPLQITAGVSFLHIVALTADRCIAVTKPLRYVQIVTLKRIAIVLGSFWILSALLNNVRFIDLFKDLQTNTTIPDHNTTICGMPYSGSTTLTFGWIVLCVIVVLMVVLPVTNISLLRIAMKQARKIAIQREVMRVQQNQPPPQDDRLKAFKTILLIVSLFIIFSFPFPLYLVLRLTTYVSPLTFMVCTHFFLVWHTIGLIVHPLLYGFRDRAFRIGFQNILRQCRATQ